MIPVFLVSQNIFFACLRESFMKALDKNEKTTYDGFEQMIKLCAYEQN